MTDLAETILRDVPRYWQASNRSLQPATDGEWLSRADVLAALSAALDGVDERVRVHLLHLRDDLGPWSKQSADLITALLAQNAALRAEVRKSAMDAVSAGCQAQEAWEAQKAAEAEVEKLRGALQIAKSIFDTPIGLRRLGIDPNTDERLIEFRALTTEADNG